MDVCISTAGVSNLNRLIGDEIFGELFDAVTRTSLSLRDRFLGDGDAKAVEFFIICIDIVSYKTRDNEVDEDTWEIKEWAKRLAVKPIARFGTVLSEPESGSTQNIH